MNTRQQTPQLIKKILTNFRYLATFLSGGCLGVGSAGDCLIIGHTKVCKVNRLDWGQRRNKRNFKWIGHHNQFVGPKTNALDEKETTLAK
jgi:hypothetical protein